MTQRLVPREELVSSTASSFGALDVFGVVDSPTSSLASVVLAVVDGGSFLVNGHGAAVAAVSVGSGRMGTMCAVDKVVELEDGVGPILELLPVGQHWTGAGLEQNPGFTGAPRHVCSAVSMQRPGWPYLCHQSEHAPLCKVKPRQCHFQNGLQGKDVSTARKEESEGRRERGERTGEREGRHDRV